MPTGPGNPPQGYLDGGNSPRIWTPSTRPFKMFNVRAGEWVFIELSFPSTNTGNVVIRPNSFFVHVLYSPWTDDSTEQKVGGRLQPVSYGGSAKKDRSQYRWDPGFCVQVPWDGEISVIAGGDSPTTAKLEVICKRGFQPEEPVRDPHYSEGTELPFDGGPDSMLDMIDAAARLELASEDPDEYGTLLDPSPGRRDGGNMAALRSRRVYPPPVIGTPGLVPATWNAVPAGLAQAFPSGAVGIEAADATGIPSNPIPFLIRALGSGAYDTPFVVQSGAQPRNLGSLGQGGGSFGSVPATWRPLSDCTQVVVWSRVGN